MIFWIVGRNESECGWGNIFPFLLTILTHSRGGGGIRYRNKFYHGSFYSGVLGKYCIMDRFSLGVHTNILSWIVFFRGFYANIVLLISFYLGDHTNISAWIVFFSVCFIQIIYNGFYFTPGFYINIVSQIAFSQDFTTVILHLF